MSRRSAAKQAGTASQCRGADPAHFGSPSTDKAALGGEGGSKAESRSGQSASGVRGYHMLLHTQVHYETCGALRPKLNQNCTHLTHFFGTVSRCSAAKQAGTDSRCWRFLRPPCAPRPRAGSKWTSGAIRKSSSAALRWQTPGR